MLGQTIAHYRITAKLGAGGMGEVYRATDSQLDRDVALKVLPADSLHDPAARARLLREARSAATLNHPNICTIYEVGETDGQAYIAMELVEGKPLSDSVRGEALSGEIVLRCGVQIADAVAHAHERRERASSNEVESLCGGRYGSIPWIPIRCEWHAAGHVQLRLGSLQPGWFGEFSPLSVFSDQSA